MEGRGNLIAAIIVIVLVLAVVLGTILYLTKSFGGKLNLFNSFSRLTPAPKKTATPSPTFIPSTTSGQFSLAPQPTPSSTITTSGVYNVYHGKGFQLQYPKNWGLLTCTTSQNFELDPYNSNNQTVPCDRATKPITVLVDQGVACKGEFKKIGSHQVSVSKMQYRDWFTNEYCLNEAGHNIDITNRVSNRGLSGTGKDDFSTQIEQIISTITFQ